MRDQARYRSRVVTAALMVVVLILTATTANVSAQDSGTGVLWQASYWANSSLTGEPVLRRVEPALDHNWGTWSPDPRIPPDGFSARWTTAVYLGGGIYRFTATSDDGIRVWVNNELIIDEWYDHPALTVSAEVSLAPGTHSLRVEYYESGGVALARLTWDRISIADDAWQGEYFDNLTLRGAPSLVRVDEEISFDWGDGSPAPNLIPPDRFSVRWTRFVTLDAGIYRFVATSDDGIRVWVNNDLVIDDWTVHSARTTAVEIPLEAGAHHLRVEYFENTGQALVSVSFGRLSASIVDWRAEYFNTNTLRGEPDLVRMERSIDLDVGDGSPAPGIIRADRFSVRWQATLDLPRGDYRFSMTVDDGGRLWIGDRLLIDAWWDQAATTYTADIWLSGGPVPVRMEYYENMGQAVASLSWTRLGAPPERGAVVVDNIDVGFVRGGSPGNWYQEDGGFQSTFLWSWNSEAARLNYNWARWAPYLGPGAYEVQVFIPQDSATTSSARYWIAHAGDVTLRVVDQAANQGTWVSLGIYYFHGSVEEYVSLSNLTAEPHTSRRVAFDAVQWIPQR
jgi:hypothetical protein